MLVSANAQQEITLTKVNEAAWSSNLKTADCRQGFGLQNNFYIQDKGQQLGQVLNLNGEFATDNFSEDYCHYPSTANTACTYDESGNFIFAGWAFPNAPGADAAITIVSADRTQTKQVTIPADLIKGRCDFLGMGKGNLLQEGQLLVVGATNTGVAVLTFNENGLDEDNSYEATVNGTTVAATSSTIVSPWTDHNGVGHYLYVTRNAKPVDMAMEDDGNFTGQPLTLPNKGACNGAQAFTMGGRNFIVYPTLENYLDGFAIAELLIDENNTITVSEEPVASVAAVATANANVFQADWVNAEVISESKANIYQVYPGGALRKYEFYVPGAQTAVNDVNANKTVSSVQYVNLAGQMSATPFEGVNIMVKTYTDGSKHAVKVVK